MRARDGKGLLMALLALGVGFPSAGCEINNPTYFAADQPLVVGGMDGDGMPRPGAASGLVTLAFRAPTAGEQTKLDAESTRLGFLVPWLRRSDIHIEVLYTITNLTGKPGTAQVLINGANEITNYDPALIGDALAMMLPPGEDAPVVLPLIQGIPVMLGPSQVLQGVVREDDFAEAELDLDAIGRWMASAPAVLINRSAVDPIGLEMMPSTSVVPAIFRVSLTFTADTEMRLEYLVRVRDDADRLAGSGPQFQPMPMDFVPMVTYTP